jgi:hypothetical protein
MLHEKRISVLKEESEVPLIGTHFLWGFAAVINSGKVEGENIS